VVLNNVATHAIHRHRAAFPLHDYQPALQVWLAKYYEALVAVKILSKVG
jgi:hypothetical protein